MYQGNLGFGSFYGGYGPQNPYIGQQAQAMIDQSNQNLSQNILPNVNSGAVAAGGFGGSRHGIAQGMAIQGQQNSINSALSNLYANAYNTDQTLGNQFSIARMNADTTARGQDLNYNLGQQQNQLGYAGLQNSANIANMQNQTALRGQDLQTGLGYAGLRNQYDISGLNNQTQRDIASQQNQLGYAGLRNQYDIAGLQNSATLRGQDLNYGLGMAQNATSQRGQDLSYSANMAQNSTMQRGQDYNLAANILQNSTAQRGQDLNYNLGLGQNANTAAGQMMNFYTNNRQLDQSGVRLGADLFNMGNQGYLNQGQGIYNLGLTGQQAPWTASGSFNNAVTPYTGYGQSTTSQNGSAAGGILGGALAGGQLFNMFRGGSAVTPSNLATANASADPLGSLIGLQGW